MPEEGSVTPSPVTGNTTFGGGGNAPRWIQPFFASCFSSSRSRLSAFRRVSTTELT